MTYINISSQNKTDDELITHTQHTHAHKLTVDTLSLLKSAKNVFKMCLQIGLIVLYSVITMRRSLPGQLLPLCMGRRMKSHGGHLSLTCKEEARPDHEDKCSLDRLNLSQPMMC